MGDLELLHASRRGSGVGAVPFARHAFFIILMLTAALGLLAGAAVALGSPVGEGRGDTFPAADAAAGQTVYQQNCQGCHGPKGEGLVAPSLAAAAFPGLVAPKVRVGGGGMPAFEAKLSTAQIDDVALYVAQQLADPAARTATVAGGGVIYRLYCAGCHGATGRGGALVEGRNAPSLGSRPAANALAAVLKGPRNMPVFTGTLDVRQQASVARYIQTAIDDPAHPGGLGLGFIGPVVEAVISWIGLVVLVLIAVWLAWRKGADADA